MSKMRKTDTAEQLKESSSRISEHLNLSIYLRNLYSATNYSVQAWAKWKMIKPILPQSP